MIPLIIGGDEIAEFVREHGGRVWLRRSDPVPTLRDFPVLGFDHTGHPLPVALFKLDSERRFSQTAVIGEHHPGRLQRLPIDGSFGTPLD